MAKDRIRLELISTGVALRSKGSELGSADQQRVFDNLTASLVEQGKWLAANRLKLNEDKTDALLVSSKDNVAKKRIASIPLVVGWNSLDFSVMRVNSAEATAERETSSVINGCSDDDGWGIETVRKLGCEPDGRPGATLAGVEASGMPVSQPFIIGTWTIRFFCAPADDDDDFSKYSSKFESELDIISTSDTDDVDPQDEDSDFLLSENLRFLGLELDDALLGVVSFGIGGMVLDPGE
ncbi:hypothetical protein DAPPUDRAFT_108640 [Daphnia pulex]|uniref:Uncharacterized protein n=1 Tax=Daphnia pulex TaxID=6669 RepID=E9H0R6_DAPPU|nr:hypothetical protein DAPPUDRAFT_108640 [Daphnia pulex]|eukprot:EFX74691.1 hypothetical protein DAPPUDRAFT_108640 [Daphnia pulex]